jgi:Ca2+/Na+ antiporter
MIFNFFIISLFYLVVYAITLGIRNPRVYKTFMINIRGGVRTMSAVFISLLGFSLVMSYSFSLAFSAPFFNFSGILLLPLFSVLLLVFLYYARAVEGDLFKKKIPAGKLRVGDVIISDKWRGLTEKEVARLKKKGGSVWIKEGVRFAPVFIICLLVTLFFGSLWHFMFPQL